MYLIQVPYLSEKLRRSYYKKLEVYEIVQDEKYPHVFTSVKLWTYTRGKWVEEPCTSYSEIIHNPNLIKVNDGIYGKHRKGSVLFDDLELAQVNKIILVHRLRQEYENEIKNILETMERNVPDLSKEYEQIKHKHAELFI